MYSFLKMFFNAMFIFSLVLAMGKMNGDLSHVSWLVIMAPVLAPIVLVGFFFMSGLSIIFGC